MKKFVILAAVAAISLGGLSGCNTFQNAGTKQTVGALGGAVGGGLLGSQIGGGSGRLIATGAGVLLGGLLGSEIGASLDNADKAYAMQAQNQALAAPVGERITWNNPNSGNSGYITPVRDGYASSGRYCREYQQEITVGGKRESAYGTACQKPDGSWEIVS
ncbi:MAG TPA: RT0821/Lpp0805 family surface protein [Alphaproteobacteria bacterium]|nr:RT0821/Lpp0805 family surface protein [Alphaproteobacteria bacterium]